jgi:hypothetical protein
MARVPAVFLQVPGANLDVAAASIPSLSPLPFSLLPLPLLPLMQLPRTPQLPHLLLVWAVRDSLGPDSALLHLTLKVLDTLPDFRF